MTVLWQTAAANCWPATIALRRDQCATNFDPPAPEEHRAPRPSKARGPDPAKRKKAKAARRARRKNR